MTLRLKHFAILIASLVISYSTQAQSVTGTTTSSSANFQVAGETGGASLGVTGAAGGSGFLSVNGEVGGTSGAFINLNRSTDGQFSRLRFNRNNNAIFSFSSDAWDLGMRADDHFRITNTTSTLLGGTTYQDYLYMSSTGTTNLQNTTQVSLRVGTSTKIRAVAAGGLIFGTLGIGTTTPDGELEISHNSTTSNAHLDLHETEANDYARIKMSNNGTDYWDIAGATGTTDKFNLYFYNGSSGNNFLSIDPNLNNIIIDGDVVPGDIAYDLGNNSASEHWDDCVADDFINFSDRRLKENITDYSSVLKSVMKLRPVTYKYIASHNQDNRQRSGFIAQEMQEIFPNVVVTEDVDVDAMTHEVTRTQAEFLSMNYIELIPVLTKAIQEQQNIIKTQEQEVDELKELIASMNQRILDLENK